MKTAFVVVGPESSGNRFMVQLLIEAGCTGKSTAATNGQPWDIHYGAFVSIPKDGPETIAFHRSIPHGSYRVNLGFAIDKAHEAGYVVTFLVMVREGYSTTISQLLTQDVRTTKKAPTKNIQMAYWTRYFRKHPGEKHQLHYGAL